MNVGVTTTQDVLKVFQHSLTVAYMKIWNRATNDMLCTFARVIVLIKLVNVHQFSNQDFIC